jgi:hypothetical protein
MDIFERAVHLLEGQEVHNYTWHGADGAVVEQEYISNGTERWINRVKKRGVLTGEELLAVILFVVEDFTDSTRDGKVIINEWANEICSALDEKNIIARSHDSYLPLDGRPDNWGWVIKLSDADEFVKSRGMGWTCTEIVEHLYKETFPNLDGCDGERIDTSKPIKYTTCDLNILNEAVQRFWANHDPEAPPKKDVVVAWLTEKKVSKKIAEAMDTIIRSDKSRKGGNKRVTPVTPSK